MFGLGPQFADLSSKLVFPLILATEVSYAFLQAYPVI